MKYCSYFSSSYLNTDLIYINSIEMSYVSQDKKQNHLVNTSFLSQFTNTEISHNTKTENKSPLSNKVINS